MPAGNTHTTINLAATPIMFFAINQQHLIVLPYLATGCAAFVFATLFMSPDLDLFNSNPTHHWGMLKYIWFPYSKMFHHRGISHSLFFGSLTRIIYLFVVCLLIASCYFLLKETLSQTNVAQMNQKINQSKDLYSIINNQWLIYRFYFAAILSGIWLSDAYHIVSDRIYSSIKGLKHGAHL